MLGGPYHQLRPRADGGRRYLKFHKISGLSTTGAGGLTKSPFSTPVVQVSNVGEHVVNPDIGQSPER